MKVAFLGLGNMGAGLARNVLQAGHELTVWNRTAAKTVPFEEEGASAAPTIEQAVCDAEVVVTSLMDDRSILDAVSGAMLEALPLGAVHVCATTISPEASAKLEQLHRDHGSHYVAGPVVGRPDAAAAGQLVSILAGEADAVEKAAAVAEAYSRKFIKLPGAAPRANVFKLCVNYSAISIIELMGEVYSLAEKSDIDLALLEEFYHEWFATPILKMYASKLIKRHFSDGGFVMTGGLKDVQLMLSTSEAGGVDFGIGRVIESKMQQAVSEGLERHDWSAIYEVSRARAGLDSIVGK